MFFKKFKKVESIENISTHKELVCTLTYANRNTPPLTVSISDPTQFDTMRDMLSNNIGKNCVYYCNNGAVNLKYFCMVTFTEKDVAD